MGPNLIFLIRRSFPYVFMWNFKHNWRITLYLCVVTQNFMLLQSSDNPESRVVCLCVCTSTTHATRPLRQRGCHTREPCRAAYDWSLLQRIQLYKVVGHVIKIYRRYSATTGVVHTAVLLRRSLLLKSVIYDFMKHIKTSDVHMSDKF